MNINRNDKSSNPRAELSRRAEIRLGFRCNARCGFCYYQDLLDTPKDKEPTTQQLDKMLSALRGMKAVEVEFTGGEPTIRSDLFHLAQRARSLGFENVSLITNGLRCANPVYAKQLVESGVNDVLFSLHGHTATIHDAHTAIHGSFDKILLAIENVRALGARVRISTTVTGCNYTFTKEIVEQALRLKAECIHLAVFSPASQARGSQKQFFVTYTQASEAIKEAINIYQNQLPPLSVKYIPFCFMQGYEQYVMNFYQQSYDPDDWNYYMSNKVRRAPGGMRAFAFDVTVLAGMLLAKDWTIPRRQGPLGMKVHGFTWIVELLIKRRLPACRQCRYDVVCDHVWKDYLNVFGGDEIAPVPGTKLKDPAWSYVMSNYRKPGERVGLCSRCVL